jgi:hypothetical protein
VISRAVEKRRREFGRCGTAPVARWANSVYPQWWCCPASAVTIALDDERAGLAKMAAAQCAGIGSCSAPRRRCTKHGSSCLIAGWVLSTPVSPIDSAVIGHTEDTFSARLLVSGPTIAGEQLTGFAGCWLISDSLVIYCCRVSPTITSDSAQFQVNVVRAGGMGLTENFDDHAR